MRRDSQPGPRDKMKALYTHFLRPMLFQLDPETAHRFSLRALSCLRPVARGLPSWSETNDSRLTQNLWNIPFSNPFGLAGGFDKNAECADLWRLFGFSFVEVGTVTPQPQAGNPRPRLFRYPDQRAIVNRMGFNNDGAEKIAARLAALHAKGRLQGTVVGISLGKQKDTPPHEIDLVIRDYVTVLETLHPYGDYFAVNVSSPNTPELRSLQQQEVLAPLLRALLIRLEVKALQEGRRRKPLCVKLAPDLSDEQLQEALQVITNLKLDGIIAANTTNQTGALESGGLSGLPLRQRSTEMIRRIAQLTQGAIPILGCGGVFTWEDAVEKLEAGAWLIQLYTGFVYEGPTVVRDLAWGLLAYLERRALSSLSALRPYS